jgi:rubrerythrin
MAVADISARDIVEAAIEKEKKRNRFYATASELCANADMKGLFRFLAMEESRHVTVFAHIRDSLPEGTDPAKHRVDIKVFEDPIISDQSFPEMDSREFVQKAIDTWNIFRLAIGFEKDSIQYFTKLLSLLSASNQQIVLDLIEEEKGHIRKLAEVMQQIGD